MLIVLYVSNANNQMSVYDSGFILPINLAIYIGILSNVLYMKIKGII